METEQNNSIAESNENNIKDILFKYVSHWKLFIVSFVISIICAVVYLRYQTPVYEVNASILIKDDKKGSSLFDELTVFEDLGILKNNNSIENEIEILKSRSLMNLVVKELRLNVQYFSYGRPIEHERYADSPFIADYILADSTKNITGSWTIFPESSTSFKLLDGKGKTFMGNYKFGEAIKIPFGKLIITTTKFLNDSYLNKNFRIIIKPIEAVVDGYIAAIKVTPVNKNANVITISLRDAIPQKAVAVLDNLIKQHNLDAIADKNQVSQNTYNFISERIKFIAQELNEVEGTAEEFKSRNKLVDIKTDGTIFLETGSESEKKLLEASTQKQIAQFMVDYLAKHEDATTLIPANIGITDVSIAAQIVECNNLILERGRLIRFSGEKNPVINSLENQIMSYRKGISESISNYLNSMKIQESELSKMDHRINSKISSVPKYEREFRVIQRQQQIKEALYLYLLQKREETNIALAVTVANAKVIDYAYSNGKVVAPKKQVIYIMFAVLGLILPALFLYLLEVTDTKVRSRIDIDEKKLPFIGEIPLTNPKKKLAISKNDNSAVAEAFRLLRTNLDFVLGTGKNKGRTVFITSTLGREGKSFIALNLATSIALSGKKVILLGMDFRAPKILKYLELSDKEGLTNYISRSDIDLKSIIFSAPHCENLFILPSGTIPPNPAELLMNDRVAEIFDRIKEEYDYIIVDTAPVGMVTDTLLISKFADAFLYVVRANVLEKRLLSLATSIYKEKRFENMTVLMNGTSGRKSYGYGYGYGYGDAYTSDARPKSLFNKIFRRNID